MKLLGSIYIAIAILVVTAAIGWYVDISHEQMHQRHLAVHTQLERMVRLRQELNGMLMVAVLEENTLRASTYPRVYEDLQNTLQSVQQLTPSNSSTAPTRKPSARARIRAKRWACAPKSVVSALMAVSLLIS